MDVYIAQGEDRGPLFRVGALMVFYDPDTAHDAVEAMDQPGFVAKMSAARVVERLRETGNDRVVVVLSDEEGYDTTVDGFERLAEQNDAAMPGLIEEAKEARAYQLIGEMLEDGLLEFDFETGKVRATGKGLEGEG